MVARNRWSKARYAHETSQRTLDRKLIISCTGTFLKILSVPFDTDIRTCSDFPSPSNAAFNHAISMVRSDAAESSFTASAHIDADQDYLSTTNSQASSTTETLEWPTSAIKDL